MLGLQKQGVARNTFSGSRARTSGRQALQVSCQSGRHIGSSSSRRDVLLLSSALALALPRVASAEEAGAAAVAQVTEAAVAAAPSVDAAAAAQKYEDVDFELTVPGSFKEQDINPPVREDRPGPAPASSPLRARFDSPDGRATISVVVKGAQTIKPSFLQVTDITAYGGLEEAAKLLLPRGSTVLRARTITEAVPPKTTPMGTVELPPKSYYIYEFVTQNGLHVALAAAAQRGKVYVCGGSAQDNGNWPQAAPQLSSAVSSFRLRDGVSIY